MAAAASPAAAGEEPRPSRGRSTCPDATSSAATRCPSVCLSVCLPVCLSISKGARAVKPHPALQHARLLLDAATKGREHAQRSHAPAIVCGDRHGLYTYRGH